MVLNIHRDLFKSQDAVYAHLRIIKPTLEYKMVIMSSILKTKKLCLEIGLSKTPKAHLIFDHVTDEQDVFDVMGGKIEYFLGRIH